ncbi:MAG TPA: ATP-binding cassette domain-containing protein [Ignavibacteriales bacterium]|nr:ATP-binding cassette domain-containing protein [Ignavibacteriales bacterium]
MNVDINGLSVKYKNNGRENTALDRLSLYIKEGETCAVIGPSGCGKTTLIYVLSGILKDFTGEALLGGAAVDPKRQHIGLIPQNCGLLEWADVYRNAIIGIKTARTNAKPNRKNVISFLNKIGLGGYETKYPGSLSGGERQRVSIARAFLMKPDILLMDEPFSSLDAITREEMQHVFLNLLTDKPTTTLIVTHSIEEAIYLGQSIAVMSPAPGRIMEVVRNPLFGQKHLRVSEDFYRSIIELRKKAKEIWLNY